MKAYGKYILLRPFEQLKKPEDKSEEKNFQSGRGRVLSIGDEVKGIKVGSVVRFSHHQEEEVEGYVAENSPEEIVWLVPAEVIVAIE